MQWLCNADIKGRGRVEMGREEERRGGEERRGEAGLN
jgi:hypothetical protein